MAKSLRRHQAPPLTKPTLVRSSLSDAVLVEANKASLLKDEVLPPWQQPVQIHLSSDRSSGMQVTDLWTLKMRKNIVKALFPKKNTSKIGAVFHSHQRKADSDKLQKRWGVYMDSPVTLPLGSQTSRNAAKLPPLSVSASSMHIKPKGALTRHRLQG